MPKLHGSPFAQVLKVKKVAQFQGRGHEAETETEKDSPPIYRNLNPLDFILMKEEYIRKNPPPPKKEFVKVNNNVRNNKWNS